MSAKEILVIMADELADTHHFDRPIDKALQELQSLLLTEEEIEKVCCVELLHPDTIYDLENKETKIQDLMPILAIIIAQALHQAQLKKWGGK